MKFRVTLVEKAWSLVECSLSLSAYSMTGSESTYSTFFMGNPLLDMQVTHGENLLKKYGLKADDAILADEDLHAGMYGLPC